MVTVAELAAVPPEPVQLRVKVELAVKLPVLWEPEVALLPLQLPEAVQEVALAELQVKVEALPEVNEVGLAVMVTVGAGGGGTALTVTEAELLVLLPLIPIQVSV